MYKKKKQLERFKSELHTITSMPLETVEARLYELDDESDEIQVQTQYLDQDHMMFCMIYHNSKNSKIAEIIGKLSRWEGTFTRVDADSRRFTSLESLDLLLNSLRIIGIIILLYPACGIMGQLMFAENAANFFGLVVALMIGFASTRYLAPIDLSRDQRYTAYKVVDSMMQGIADKLTEDRPGAQPGLEFDGSQDSLAHLLRQEKFRHFAVGDDGELIR